MFYVIDAYYFKKTSISQYQTEKSVVCPLVFCVCTYVNRMICYVMNKFHSRPWKVILKQCGGFKFQHFFPL